jgi:hypothetical protein
MGWRDLLTKGNETVTLPWLGGRTLRSRTQTWTFGPEVRTPGEHGWYRFKLAGRLVVNPDPVDAQPELLGSLVKGYLVGDRIVADNARVDPDPKHVVEFSERVHLLEPGLDRFVRVAAGRIYADGPLIYCNQEMPLGPEEVVLQAFLDQKPTVSDVKGVSPALDAAFRMEGWQREEAERRRRELEQLRREEEERWQKEERRRQLVEKLGDGAGRREMARVDFTEAARAALVVGGAELLDDRKHGRRGEHVVRYRLDGQRFECICDEQLHIVDAGICLTDHRSGEKGDTYFTLESLPAVIREANRAGKLVVYRHV